MPGAPSPLHSYQTVQPSPLRDRHQAQALNAQGLRFARENQPDRAEDAFRQAIRADISCGSAHNNLGLVLLEKGAVYEAATEFAFAQKLAPQSAEPAMNLARLYERIGWWKEAQSQYQRVLAIAPSDVNALGRLTRCQLEEGQSNFDELRPLLAKLAEQEEDEQWRSWAAEKLADPPAP